MYKELQFTEIEISRCLELIKVVAPNMAKNNIQYDSQKKVFHDNKGTIIQPFNFVYDLIIHKYVTNILFEGMLKDAQSQNKFINAYVSTLCVNDSAGSHLLKNAIASIYKALKTASKL